MRLDLTDEKAVAQSLKDNHVEGVTHVFHTAFSGANPCAWPIKMSTVVVRTLRFSHCA